MGIGIVKRGFRPDELVLSRWRSEYFSTTSIPKEQVPPVWILSTILQIIVFILSISGRMSHHCRQYRDEYWSDDVVCSWRYHGNGICTSEYQPEEEQRYDADDGYHTSSHQSQRNQSNASSLKIISKIYDLCSSTRILNVLSVLSLLLKGLCGEILMGTLQWWVSPHLLPPLSFSIFPFPYFLFHDSTFRDTIHRWCISSTLHPPRRRLHIHLSTLLNNIDICCDDK